MLLNCPSRSATMLPDANRQQSWHIPGGSYQPNRITRSVHSDGSLFGCVRHSALTHRPVPHLRSDSAPVWRGNTSWTRWFSAHATTDNQQAAGKINVHHRRSGPFHRPRPVPHPRRLILAHGHPGSGNCHDFSSGKSDHPSGWSRARAADHSLWNHRGAPPDRRASGSSPIHATTIASFDHNPGSPGRSLVRSSQTPHRARSQTAAQTHAR